MNTLLRSIAAAILIALSVQFFTVGVIAPNLPSLQRTRTLSFPQATRLVHIGNHDGAILVETHPGQSIEIVADIRAYVHNPIWKGLAEEYLDTLVRTDRISDTLSIMTEPEERPDELDLRVDYRILVPEGTDIGAVSMNGNVRVGPGCGNIRIKGNYADINIAESSGTVVAKTVTGRIEVSGAKKDTTLETVNGRVYATLASGALEASTTTGNIYVTLAGTEVDACNLTVMNGDITLVMSQAGSARVQASTGRGAISSDFSLEQREGVQRRRELRGVIGTGRTELTLESLNGSIRLTRSMT